MAKRDNTTRLKVDVSAQRNSFHAEVGEQYSGNAQSNAPTLFQRK